MKVNDAYKRVSEKLLGKAWSVLEDEPRESTDASVELTATDTEPEATHPPCMWCRKTFSVEDGRRNAFVFTGDESEGWLCPGCFAPIFQAIKDQAKVLDKPLLQQIRQMESYVASADALANQQALVALRGSGIPHKMPIQWQANSCVQHPTAEQLYCVHDMDPCKEACRKCGLTSRELLLSQGPRY